jgi:hypothetical protein
VNVLDLQIVDGHQDAETAGTIEDKLEECGKRIEQERAVKEYPVQIHQLIARKRRY